MIYDEETKREELQQKEQKFCTKVKISLLYKKKYIPCNELVSPYINKFDLTRQTYSRPTKQTALLWRSVGELLHNDLNDAWAVETKERLFGTIDLVAEEALLHKRCNINFLRGGINFREGDIVKKKMMFVQICLMNSISDELCNFCLHLSDFIRNCYYLIKFQTYHWLT